MWEGNWAEYWDAEKVVCLVEMLVGELALMVARKVGWLGSGTVVQLVDEMVDSWVGVKVAATAAKSDTSIIMSVQQ
jgi:hypothetical protein